jgi:hypothetical protein
MNIQSWDGTTLGTQWKISCQAQQYAAVMIYNDLDDTGFGEVHYHSTYSGGSIWLGSGCPWYPPGSEETALTNFYVSVTSILEYVGGYRTGRRDVIKIGAEYGYNPYILMTFELSNVVHGVSGEWMSLPAGYPRFLNGDCTQNDETPGLWGDSAEITVETCFDVPVESTTWGQIKALYR